jgi:carbon storage regulator CsrA
MLVLSRKAGEKVIIGNDITITLVEIDGNRVRLGIDAPDDIRILRAELADWLQPEETAPKAKSAPRPRYPRQSWQPETTSC